MYNEEVTKQDRRHRGGAPPYTLYVINFGSYNFYLVLPALQSTKKAQTNYKVLKKKKVTGLFLAIVARNALLKYFKKYFYQKSSNSKHD